MSGDVRDQPIAVVGRSCILPDATDPEAFWANVLAGKVSLRGVPEGRWRLPAESAMGTPDDFTDRTWSDVGGYVEGFTAEDLDRALGREVAGPGRSPVDALDAGALDPLFQWTLHGAAEALRESGRQELRHRSGLVLGNLSFPSTGMASYAEHVWLASQEPWVRARFGIKMGERPPAAHRFMSGLPAHLAARRLGLGLGAFSVDAACASSLYAIKLACDRLVDRRADLMLAGGVSSADSLFVHVSFCSLSALSRSGRSRPFSRHADGLVPAEGAAFVALMRLEDAIAADAPIFGVIRGVGLSNDGRGNGMLSPSEAGQERAIRAAYEAAGVSPDSVGLLECHATGTRLGDAAEVRSTSRVFASARGLPIGSVKSNVGHLLTAAGAAGLLKVLGALRAGVRPATPGVDDPLPELAASPLRLLTEAEEWTGLRRAAVSAFGFGGNNAHLVVDAWAGDDVGFPALPRPPRPGPSAPDTALFDGSAGQAQPASAEQVAIVAIGAKVSDGKDTHDLCDTLMSGLPNTAARETVEVSVEGLAFPPLDLAHIQAQQLLVLQTARDAVAGMRLPKDRTAVLVGMGCDPEVARYVARWRVPGWIAPGGPVLGPEDLERLRDAVRPPQTAAGVVGSMPNIVANRINAQLGLTGPGFTVSAEEASGTAALEIGARFLRAGEADAVLVGAVDLCHEPVHLAALSDLGLPGIPGDAAVVLVLKRLSDARADGDEIIALLGGGPGELVEPAVPAPEWTVGDAGPAASGEHLDPGLLFGRAHAASGLLSVAVAALAVRHRATPRVGSPAVPAFGRQTVETAVEPLGGSVTRAWLRPGDTAAFVAEPPPVLQVYSGRDREGVAAALAAGRESADGPARLVIVSAGAEERAASAEAARRWLLGRGRRPANVAFRDRPVHGEVAFVFSGGSMAYPGMARELMLAFPDLLDEIQERCGPLRDLVGWAFAPGAPRPRHALDQVWGAAVVGQLHAAITRNVLGITPNASIGYSSGELTALTALGAWPDVTSLAEGAQDPDLFAGEPAGDLDVVRAAWRRKGVQGTRWASYLVEGPAERVRAALADEPAVHVMVVNAPDSCIIGGEADSCGRVLRRLGDLNTLPIEYEIAAHVPELEETRSRWKEIYQLPTAAITDVRFYTCSTRQWFHPTVEAAQDALVSQQLGTVDFAGTVEQAWEDGARIFIEHGPRHLCASWIRRTLRDREYVTVSLDGPDGRDLHQLMRAVAELVAAGVPVDTDALTGRLSAARPTRGAVGRELVLPAHPPAVRLPEQRTPEIMRPAPDWPPTSEAAAAEGASTESFTVEETTGTGTAQPATAGGPPPEPANTEHAHHPVPLSPATASVDRSGAFARQVAEQYRLLGEAHRQSLAAQAQAYTQWLATQRMTGLLTRLPVDPRPVGDAHAVVTADRPRPAGELPSAAVDERRTAQVPGAATLDEPPPRAQASTALAVHRPQPTGEAPAAVQRQPCGPEFSRPELEELASGPIAPLFGPEFAVQDSYPRIIRLPRPPLLLVDRVLGMDAVPGSQGTGTIWTETDVLPDSWYLDTHGRMPAGIAAEAGQASLLLLSWLGMDHLSKGERVYRLLGCKITYHGPLPVPGETLRYQIDLDGTDIFGDTAPVFSFHFDCFRGGEPLLTVSEGRAGLFTGAELAGGQGLRWDPADQVLAPGGVVDPPAVSCGSSAFSREQVQAFVDGRPEDCFGPGWEVTRTHLSTPRINGGRGQFLHEVTAFEPDGGPWGRGYLRGEMHVTGDEFFFPAHFPGDPCMPGTLMSEGCFQAMAFYLAASGHTVNHDGWRFEPVPGIPYPYTLRGQVTPRSKSLVYEVFVIEVSAGPLPTLVADVLCTVDGIKACLGRGLRLRLVPDWPLTHWRELGPPTQQTTGDPVPPPVLAGLRGHRENRPAAEADGFVFDYPAMLACAWGKPSDGFGPPYARFDNHRHVARMPGPPFHFMSRVAALDGPPWELRTGTGAEIEYDVPDDVWYFEQNDWPVMPLAVFMEVVLQATGWLGAYVGTALERGTDLHLRNLDGTATVLREIGPGTRRLTTRTRLTSVAWDGDVAIETFEAECLADSVPAFRLTTVFGFFPSSAFDNQVGILPSGAERELLTRSSDFAVELASRPDRYFGGSLRLPGPMLLMLDRVTGYWPEAGRFGLGRLRAEKDVDAGEWFFRAHFFQDPVQPGSLGVQAICQLVQFYAIERDLACGMRRPRFVPVVQDSPVTWKYRGQVTPHHRNITVEAEIVEVDEGEHGRRVIANGWLWADDTRIYQVERLGVEIVEADR